MIFLVIDVSFELFCFEVSSRFDSVIGFGGWGNFGGDWDRWINEVIGF